MMGIIKRLFKSIAIAIMFIVSYFFVILNMLVFGWILYVLFNKDYYETVLYPFTWLDAVINIEI